jgi:cytochrome c oxidase assembly protein subunit 15
VFTAASTFILIVAGGLVTSNSAGLSVPDWPNTYGQFMFAFPFGDMVGGILYEHGHRMIASTVGFLTVLLAIWVWRREERIWLKRLAVGALGAVVAQGVLGGMTVLFYLPTAVSSAHALLAQSFFCMTIAIAYFTSREGMAAMKQVPDTGRPTLTRVSAIAVGVVLLQLMIGAWMRHSDAGLAIPDLPLAYGSLLPPMTDAALEAANVSRRAELLDPVTITQVWIHFAHRAGAVLVSIVLVMLVIRVRRAFAPVSELHQPAIAIALLLLVQLTLGVLTVLTRKDAWISTLHVATGALVLGTTFLTALRAARCTAVRIRPWKRSPLR